MIRQFCFLICMLISVAGLSKNGHDTLLPKNSIRIDIAGTSFGGIGVVFEKNLAKKKPEKYQRAFTSVEVGISYPILVDYSYLMSGIGIRRNWISKNNRMIFYAGMYGCALICFDPTPKELRNYYDSIQFYGGNYVNPIEPLLFGELGMKYSFKRIYLSAIFTPILRYDRAYNTGLYAYPWGGIGIGFVLNKK